MPLSSRYPLGALAAALSLRSSPLRSGSRAMEFVHKLVGYSGAALLFSGGHTDGGGAARGGGGVWGQWGGEKARLAPVEGPGHGSRGVL